MTCGEESQREILAKLDRTRAVKQNAMDASVLSPNVFHGRSGELIPPQTSVMVKRVTEEGGNVKCTILPETVGVAFFVTTALGSANVLCA